MTTRMMLLGTLLAAVSCGRSKDQGPTPSAAPVAPPQSPAPTPAPAPAPPPAAAGPSDAVIAHVAVTANQIDVDAARLAQDKTKNTEVKAFAELMAKDHGSVIQAAGDLAAKLKLTPEDNDTSRSLLDGARKSQDELQKLEGAAFDKAYVAHEVAYHQAVLDALDKVLIPNARNADLKDLLTSVRPVVAQHLEHAKMLGAKLGG